MCNEFVNRVVPGAMRNIGVRLNSENITLHGSQVFHIHRN